MGNKRFLEDVPSEVLLKKLRRANAGMTEVITKEIIHRTIFNTELKLDDGKDLPKIEHPNIDRIRSNRIIQHFHFLCSNAERKIYPIEIRIPKDEFEELTEKEKEFVQHCIKKHWQVEYKWI